MTTRRQQILAIVAAVIVAVVAPLFVIHHQRSTTLSPTTKVLTIVVENHTYSQMKAGMPYLWSLGQQYGYASNWSSIAKPSLPNYLAISGGSTFGITDDSPPAKHPIGGSSVFGQAFMVGKTAKAYAESMKTNCALSDSTLYAVRHNPWTYYKDERVNCGKYDVPQTALAADVATNALPNVGMLTPNLCNDAHKGGCSLSNAGSLSLPDAYLRKQLPPILSSTDFTSGRLTVVVTADEGSVSDKKVLTVVLNSGLHGVVVTSPLNHYSLTRFYDQVMGAPLLRGAATAPDMKAAFGL